MPAAARPQAKTLLCVLAGQRCFCSGPSSQQHPQILDFRTNPACQVEVHGQPCHSCDPGTVWKHDGKEVQVGGGTATKFFHVDASWAAAIRCAWQVDWGPAPAEEELIRRYSMCRHVHKYFALFRDKPIAAADEKTPATAPACCLCLKTDRQILRKGGVSVWKSTPRRGLKETAGNFSCNTPKCRLELQRLVSTGIRSKPSPEPTPRAQHQPHSTLELLHSVCSFCSDTVQLQVCIDSHRQKCQTRLG